MICVQMTFHFEPFGRVEQPAHFDVLFTRRTIPVESSTVRAFACTTTYGTTVGKLKMKAALAGEVQIRSRGLYWG